ncbi:MAG: protein kinase [Actinomycetota bacterium]|nr:protein kinase [Actinomycetota bacterium]
MSADAMTGKWIGPYKVLGLIGRGGMGVVYRAASANGRIVALKVMAPELARDDEFRDRFIRESQVDLDHPNVIEVFDAGLAEETLYLTMHLVGGPDLKSVISREGRLLPSRVVSIMKQACSALDAAHENAIVHRDIKPQNFLLEPAGGDERLYLTDFGLMKTVTSQSSLTASAHLMGTAQYMSPEQIRNRPIDGRSDIYSLGCVLFECLTGTAPYGAREEVAVLFSHVNDPPPKVSQKVPVLPDALDDIVAKAMAKDPAERYLAAGDLAADLEETLQGGRSGKLVWGDLEIRAASRAGGRDKPIGKEPVAAASRSRAGASGWVIAAVSLIVLVMVLTRGDPLTPAEGPAAALFEQESETEARLDVEEEEAEQGDRNRSTREPRPTSKTKDAKKPHERLVELDQPGSDQPHDGGAARSGERPVSHPRPGTYTYEQSGREALCPANEGCIDGADLRGPVQVRTGDVTSTSATDQVSSARVSERFSIASLVDYRPGAALLRETLMTFRTSQGGFEVRLRPDPAMELLRSPLEPNERWDGAWISAPTPGSYSVEVIDHDRSLISGRRIPTIKLKTIIRWKGDHPGSLEMTSWIDPDTRVTVESVVRMRARTGHEDFSYETTYHHVLMSGPGYSR